MAAPLFVGLDVGGTSMKAGVVDDAGKPLSNVSLPTEAHRGQEFGLERMCETIREAVAAAGLTMADIAAIGVATPGTMDIPAGMILDPPNLKPWRNVPVRALHQQDLQLADRVPERRQRGRLRRILGRRRQERPQHGAVHARHRRRRRHHHRRHGPRGQHSHGGELGHMKIEMTNPRQCGCGRWGCLEAYASATAVVNAARRPPAGRGPSRRWSTIVRI